MGMGTSRLQFESVIGNITCQHQGISAELNRNNVEVRGSCHKIINPSDVEVSVKTMRSSNMHHLK
jgi:hypothetical protein